MAKFTGEKGRHSIIIIGLVLIAVSTASAITQAPLQITQILSSESGLGNTTGNVSGTTVLGYPYMPRWSAVGGLHIEDSPILATDSLFVADVFNSQFQHVEVSGNITSNGDGSAVLGLPTGRWGNIHTFNLTGYDSLSNSTDSVTFTEIIETVNEAAAPAESPQINTTGISKGAVNMTDFNMTFYKGSLLFYPESTINTNDWSTFGYSTVNPGSVAYFGFDSYGYTGGTNYWLGGFYTPSTGAPLYYLNFGGNYSSSGVSLNEGAPSATSYLWGTTQLMGATATKHYTINVGSPSPKDITIAATSTGPGAGGDIYINPLTTSKKIDLGGELTFDGVNADGTGKALCVKSDGNVGTCTDAVNATGFCTCS